jgi:hypothetical protein
LTGLDVEENQARRLLNDLDQYRLEIGLKPEDEELAAHKWVTEVFEPVTNAVPKNMRGKLEPAELYHEVLQHRWFLSEKAGKDVGRDVAVDDYIKKILVNKPEEKAIIGSKIGSELDDTQEMRIVFPNELEDIDEVSAN